MGLNQGAAANTPLVGVSPGGNAGGGAQLDLSNLTPLSFGANAAIYEHFLLSSNSFDLENDFVVFNGGSTDGGFGYTVQ
ncbi:MAG: hypothetical protein CMJ83_18920 [Planctomycetes bacterium]|nr:hypothetical protein [Planctomycetota bacterium]